jgi:hypothetical protein
MIAVASVNLYSQINDIIENYLGPATNRFVERQVKFHLHKKPEQLKAHDIPQLTEWIKVSMALLTEDKSAIDECEQQLLALGR